MRSIGPLRLLYPLDTELVIQQPIELRFVLNLSFDLLSLSGHDELRIRQRLPAVLGHDRAELAFREMRLGRILLKIAHLRELQKIAGDVRKNVFRFPSAVDALRDLKVLIIKSANDDRAVLVGLLLVQDESQRFRREIAKSDIREIIFIADRHNDRRVVKLTPVRRPVEDPSRDQSSLKAERSKQFVE